MKLNLAIVVALFFLSSCQPENRVFEEHKALSPNIEWLKKDARSFDVLIEDTTATYALSIAFRYANGYPYRFARVALNEKTPVGVEQKEEFQLNVRKEDGSYIGEPGYDIWDSQHMVDGRRHFSEHGTYTFTIEQATPTDPLPYAMEIGLIIDRLE